MTARFFVAARGNSVDVGVDCCSKSEANDEEEVEADEESKSDPSDW